MSQIDAKQELWMQIDIGVNATVRALQTTRGKKFTAKEKEDIVQRLRPQLLDGFESNFKEVGMSREEAIEGITKLVGNALK